jgi:hypothetical protein
MSPASLELFRQDLLLQLDRVPTYAQTTAMLRIGARTGGFEPTEDEVASELAYLRDKGLVRNSAKLLSPEIARWEITAQGRDFVATLRR